MPETLRFFFFFVLVEYFLHEKCFIFVIIKIEKSLRFTFSSRRLLREVEYGKWNE